METTAATRTTKFVAAIVVALTSMSLVGCTGGSEGDDAPETDPIASDGSSGTDPGSDDPGDDDPDGDDPRCLLGDWVATGPQLEGWYRSFVGVEGIVVGSVSGEILISFDDSDFIYSTREVIVEMTVADQDATTKVTGGVAGTYLAFPDGLMSTTIDSDDLDARVTVSGIDFSSREMGITLEGAGAFSGYECTGGKLVLETQSAGAGTATIELEPAG